jgi:hypothetical protein
MAKAKDALGLRAQDDTAAMSVTISVVDFDSDTVKDKDVFAFEDVHSTLRDRVSLYGLKKLLMDRTSQIKDNPILKLKGMGEVLTRLGAGEWSAERSAGGLGVVSPEVEALAGLKGISIPDAQKALKAYSPEQREKILANPKIVAEAAKIKASREKEVPETLDDLLAV